MSLIGSQALPEMVQELQTILNAELALGNEVLEVANWPPKCRLLVILARPFGNTYPLLPFVEYRELDSPHYWKADYMYKDGLECLACQR